MNAETTTCSAPLETEDEVENHWVAKSAITSSIVTGLPVKALCGQSLIAESQGDGTVAALGAGICPLCGILYAGLHR